MSQISFRFVPKLALDSFVRKRESLVARPVAKQRKLGVGGLWAKLREPNGAAVFLMQVAARFPRLIERA